MKKFFLLAAAAVAMAACDNGEVQEEEPVAVRISATIGKAIETRASGTSWEAGDEIGVSMSGRYANMRYTTSGDGEFEGAPMYFSNKREPVTLTAYYPFAGEEGVSPEVVETSTEAERQNSDDQPGFDFLYDRKTDVRGDADAAVTFTFAHRMSKLSLEIKNGSGMTGARIVAYSIEGLVLDGMFNPATGECAAKSDAPARTLAFAVGEEGAAETQPLILFPQSTADRKVTLALEDSDGQYYSCELPFKDSLLESGNNYQFSVTVNKTGLSLNKTVISDWNTNKTDAGASSVNPK